MKKMEMVGIDNFKFNDSGKYGKAFEINVKRALNGGRGNSSKVSAKGKTDVQYHGKKLEIKSNCGELEKISKNDYVVYSMDNMAEFDKPWYASVIPADEFFQMMESLGLVREKKTTGGYIKTTIQSYKNSKKKTLALRVALAKYPTLVDWMETV